MHRFVVALAAVGILACSEDEIVPTHFTRTFSTLQCWTGPNAVQPAPCNYFFSPSHQSFVDSGRVVFNADNTLQWMLGTHTHWCPCYLGGCSNPCYDDPPTVSNRTGTYGIAGDSVVLQFSQGTPATLTLRGTIPDRVPGSWAGPDSLVCGGCVSANVIIFKSS